MFDKEKEEKRVETLPAAWCNRSQTHEEEKQDQKHKYYSWHNVDNEDRQREGELIVRHDDDGEDDVNIIKASSFSE